MNNMLITQQKSITPTTTIRQEEEREREEEASANIYHKIIPIQIKYIIKYEAGAVEHHCGLLLPVVSITRPWCPIKISKDLLVEI